MDFLFFTLRIQMHFELQNVKQLIPEYPLGQIHT